MDQDPIPPTIAWAGDHIELVDQRRLPGELRVLAVYSVDELCDAIRNLVIRGAPAIGAAGAMGIALAWVRGERVDIAASKLCATRPTAVNLAWGVDRARRAPDPVAAALEIAAEDVARNRALGSFGATLLAPGARVLTHCNAGALACVGYGTAIGVIRAAHEQGRQPFVWVGETRPVLQGARLSAWELNRLGIPVSIIVDGAAAALMGSGEVDAVIVGADRVTANGDVANKIGTFGLAVAAGYHGVPFYVAAPSPTFDRATRSGAEVVIESRDPVEILEVAGVRVAPDGVDAANPAFDITPRELVTAYITEHGVFEEASAAFDAANEPGVG
ncbi:MAG: S-methyl-5-thioribose-1-phosphate isomerase [Acidimicrobiales bacterium]|nr:S-methyl-5-thioribose-1-phosphate isomerase [Acidimicrobiales bacterium]